MNKKLIIFGGEGYIGRVVQNVLSKLGYKCFSYDNLIYTNNKKKYVKNVEKRNFIFFNNKNLKLLKKKIDKFE